MKSKLFILAVVMIGALSITGCKKYPDGPAFSMRNANLRISHTWKPTKFSYNGAVQTMDPDYKTTIKFEVALVVTKKETQISTGESTSEAGTWKWTNSKKSVEITWEASTGTSTTTVETWDVQRLTNKEFNIHETVPGGVVAIELVRAD